MKRFNSGRFVSIILICLFSLGSSEILSGAPYQNPPPRSEDLVGKWDFREGKGQYTSDGSGGGNIGVLGLSTDSDGQDPAWTSGLHDDALDFDGYDDLVNCGKNDSFRFNMGSFSLEAWVHIDENLTDNIGGILGRFQSTTGEGFLLDVLSGEGYGGLDSRYGQVCFSMNDGKLNSTWRVAEGHYGSSNGLIDIAVYDGDLFAVSSSGDLIRWTGSGWVREASPYSGEPITCLAVYNGDLYGSTGTSGYLVRWAGNSWVPAASPFTGQIIRCLAVYNGKLYGGTSPNGMLLEWNGSGPLRLAASQFGTETEITDLCVYNDQLYAITSPGGCLFQWNRVGSWSSKAVLGSGMDTLEVFKGRLFAANGDLFEWNGFNEWIRRADKSGGEGVESLCVYNGRLYGGTSVNGKLLEWDEVDSWLERAPNLDPEFSINSLRVFDGRLFAAPSGQGKLLEWSSGCSVTLDDGLPPGWSHIVAVRDSTLGRMRLYLNGRLRGTSREFLPMHFDLGNTDHLLIGVGSQDYFNGRIDRVRIFSTAVNEGFVRDEFDFFHREWTVPGPPSDPFVRAGDRFVNVTWGLPLFNGTNPLLGFRIYRGTNKDELKPYNDTSRIVHFLNDTNVSYGVRYFYLINSFTDAGESPGDELVSGIPSGRPTPPMNVTVKTGDGYVNMSWKPPLMDKGSNITQYRIERGLDLESLSDLIIRGSDRTYYNDTIVDNRQAYYYRVFAVNDVGESEPSSTVSAVPKKLPPPVNSLEYHPCDYGADLTWKRSPDPYFEHFNLYRGSRELISGGLMGYYYSNIDHTNLSHVSQDMQIDFDWGLEPPIPRMGDNEYSVRWEGFLKATHTGSHTIALRVDGGVRVWIDSIPTINTWVDGWHEELSASVYLTEGEHMLKIDYFNRESRGAIRLMWAPPETETHIIPMESLFGYHITYELIAQTELNRYTDTDLEIAKAYYYYVRAENDAGESPMGNIIEVYPIGRSGPPTAFSIELWDEVVGLKWGPPSETRGSDVLEYRIYRANGTQKVELYANVSGDVFGFNDTDIVNGLTYFYFVTAVNGAGESPGTTSIMAVPIGRPSPPTNPKVELHDEGVKASWASPVFDGGATLRGFNVYRSVNGGNRTFIYWVNDFLVHAHIDADVEEGNTYDYWITALNQVGESTFSENVSIYYPVVDTDDEVVEDEDDDRQNEGEFPTGPVIGVVVVVLLALLIVILLIMRSRKNRKEELMIGPVPVGAPPEVGMDGTYDIFHPDGEEFDEFGQPLIRDLPTIQPDMRLPAPANGQGYPRQGYSKEGYQPGQEWIQQMPQQYQQGYPVQQEPGYQLPPEQEYYLQEGYPPVEEQQGYYPDGYGDSYQYSPPGVAPQEYSEGQEYYQQVGAGTEMGHLPPDQSGDIGQGGPLEEGYYRDGLGPGDAEYLGGMQTGGNLPPGEVEERDLRLPGSDEEEG